MTGRHRKPIDPEPDGSRWKSTARELITSLVGFLPVAVIIGTELGLNDYPKTAGFMAIVSGLAVALSHPTARKWLAANGLGGTESNEKDNRKND